MATSISSSTSPVPTAAQMSATNKANAQALMTKMGAGSGVDVASLAQNLVDAERVPKENAINAKIAKSEARVSGYAAISFMLGEVKTAFEALNDKSDYGGITASVDNSSAFTATAGPSAAEGSHELTVTALAKAQRSISGTFASSTASLNGGAAMTLSLTVGSNAASTISVTAGSDTPQGVVDAINLANKGVKAQLVYTSSNDAQPYKILLTGTTGADNQFSLSDSAGALSLTNIQAAQDANFSIDGIGYTRASNTVSDALEGVTLNMRSVATTNVQLSRDTTDLTTKIKALVTAYNDTQSLLNEASNPKSTLENYGATLVNDSLVSTMKSKLRSMFMNTSSSTSNGITALRDIGISIDQKGVMSVDAVTLDSKLKSNYDDVVTMFTANRSNTSEYSVEKIALANDSVRSLAKMLRTTGDLAYQTRNTNTQITKYKDDLEVLNRRMESLLSRYNKQFAVMDNMVGSNNSLKSSLKSTFDGMMSSYTK
jgi:flagellar hook-associated protein 2